VIVQKRQNQKPKGKGQKAKVDSEGCAISEFLKSSANLLPFNFVCSLLPFDSSEAI
jgi:hypothetical protein